MKLKITNPTLPIGEIGITRAFSDHLPKTDKLTRCLDFYRDNKCFDRQIIVDGENYLHDGYCAYLVARMVGMERIKVLQVSEKRIPNAPLYDPKEVAFNATPTVAKREYKVGDKVVCLGKHHTRCPEYHPTKGTIGEVCTVDEFDATSSYRVQWEKGSTTHDDRWWAFNDDIEPCTEAQSEPIKHKFNIGDEVVVEDAGERFTTYKGWFQQVGAGESISDRYNGGCLKYGEIVKILFFGGHEFQDRTLYAVETADGKVGLITEDGLAEKPTAESIKLYCTRNISRQFKFVKGKTYNATHDFQVTDEYGAVTPCRYSSIKEHDIGNPDYANALVPLVKRPAKVGEWVFATSGDGHTAKIGVPYAVLALGDSDPDWVYVGKKGLDMCIRDDQYLVLDGYKGESE